jgi:anti-anti-sigma factor
MRLAFWLRLPFLRLAGVGHRAGQLLPRKWYAETPGPVSPPALPAKRPGPALRLEVEVLEKEEGVVVRLGGEAGVAEAGALEAALLRVAARRPACVTFDLSQLLFISTLAMGVLAAYRRAAVGAGVRVCLAPDLHPAVREALDRAGLLGLFEIAGGAEPGAGAGSGAEGAWKLYPDVEDVQRVYGITWLELVELEPQLEPLLWRARLAAVGCRTMTDWAGVFGPLRNELADLIGFTGKHHRHPVLGSTGAYEVAYWKLYDAVAGLLPGRAGGAQEAPEKQ